MVPRDQGNDPETVNKTYRFTGPYLQGECPAAAGWTEVCTPLPPKRSLLKQAEEQRLHACQRAVLGTTSIPRTVVHMEGLCVPVRHDVLLMG